MKRPLTEAEARLNRIKIQWAHAFSAARTLPKDIRGSQRWCHDNTAGSSCYGKPKHFHRHYFTNHPQPMGGEIE